MTRKLRLPFLSFYWPALKLVHLLRCRWRQQTSLKHVVEEYDIDLVIQYGADAERDTRLVPNPARRGLRERLARVRQELTPRQAALGQALAVNPEALRRTVRGLKMALVPLCRQVAALAAQITRLETRLRHTPAKVTPAALEPRAKWAILQHDRRHLVTAIKVAPMMPSAGWPSRRSGSGFSSSPATVRTLTRTSS